MHSFITFRSLFSAAFIAASLTAVYAAVCKPMPRRVNTVQSPATNPATPTTAPQTANAKFTPNSIKAGLSAGDAFDYVKDHIGWWYDWSPAPKWHSGKPIAVSMLWGDGTVDGEDAQRFAEFKALTAAPQYILGFEEPDCPSGSGSADMTVDEGVRIWETDIAKYKAQGSLLGSPGMCKQLDEDWLAAFKSKITTDWDFTAVHINKLDLDGVKKVVAHYKKYGKPLWITEFACVNDVNQFTPCTDQNQINNFINAVVPYFESEPDIAAYAYSNGLGLGNVWPMTKPDGSLSESGKTYLAAISKYH